MVINLFANIAVIFGAVYLYFRTNPDMAPPEEMSMKRKGFYIFSELGIGIILMNFSEVVRDIRFDFRFLLIAVSMKYVGWKVTVPSMFLIGLARLFYGVDKSSLTNLALTVVSMFLLPLLRKLLRRKVGDLAQLSILATSYLLLNIIASLFVTHSLKDTIWVYLLYLLISNMIVVVLYFLINDFRYLFASAHIDYLTGLYNVRKFHEDIEKLQEEEEDLILAMLDIDLFKSYNDCYGHNVGDKILKSVGETMTAFSEKNIRFYRVGGEEFAVTFQNRNLEEAKIYLDDLRAAIQHKKIRVDGETEVSITLSAGAAEKKNHEFVEETLKRADEALYQAKAEGRNRICFIFD